jgi:hypothetical protein
MTANYETLRQAHLARFGEVVPEYPQHLSWPRERILQEQTDGLRRIIRVAQEKSFWTANGCRDVDADSLTPRNLAFGLGVGRNELDNPWARDTLRDGRGGDAPFWRRLEGPLRIHSVHSIFYQSLSYG